MKKREGLILGISEIDDKYIERYAPAGVAANRLRKKKTVKLILIAAILSVMLLALFLPVYGNPPSVRRYSDSEYYSVIKKINQVCYSKPSYRNNFDLVVRYLASLRPTDGYGFNDGVKGGSYSFDRNPADLSGYTDKIIIGGNDYSFSHNAGNGSNQEYHEITDNQTAGVIEGDRVKMSDKYIYAVNGTKLDIYEYNVSAKAFFEEFYSENGRYPTSNEYTKAYYEKFNEENGRYPTADEMQSGLLAKIKSVKFAGTNNGSILPEIYLTSDCGRVYVLSASNPGDGRIVNVITVDVSDPAKASVISSVGLSGDYVGSRMENDELTVFTNFGVRAYDGDYSEEARYLPYCILNRPSTEKEFISPDRIICPEGKIDTASYTVIYSFGKDSEMKDMIALLSYASGIYVSKGSTYVTRNYNHDIGISGDKWECLNETVRLERTSGGLEYRGTVSVDGFIKDQYSFDEYNGILRIVTTSRAYERTDDGRHIITKEIINNANLYLVGIDDMKVINSVEHFAPDGEEVKSVRFDKEVAYVCTADKASVLIETIITDPVYFFDLSDINNITSTDTGTIPGFSMNLVNFGENLLLGLGFGYKESIFKAEVYKEEGDKVVSVAKFELATKGFPSNYKSYLIDREKGLIGFAYINDKNGMVYTLLHFDGERFETLARVEYGNISGPDNFRGVLFDGILAVFGTDDVKLAKVGFTGKDSEDI